MNENIFNHPSFANLSPEKLNFLMQFANQNKGDTPKAMSSSLFGAMNAAKQQGIQFSPNETDMLIEVLKQNMSPDEQRKADQILMMMRSFRK